MASAMTPPKSPSSSGAWILETILPVTSGEICANPAVLGGACSVEADNVSCKAYGKPRAGFHMGQGRRFDTTPITGKALRRLSSADCVSAHTSTTASTQDWGEIKLKNGENVSRGRTS
jgi:hypothetical protein